MDKVLVTLLLIIAGVVCSVVIINAVLPAVTGSSGAILEATAKVDERIRSQIKIVEVTNQGADFYVWVKNVGASRIGSVNSSDIFFGLEGNFSRIPYGSAGSTKPYWEYSHENDTKWGPTSTIKIIIHLNTAPAGSYYLKLVLPSGIVDQRYYSVS